MPSSTPPTVLSFSWRVGEEVGERKESWPTTCASQDSGAFSRTTPEAWTPMVPQISIFPDWGNLNQHITAMMIILDWFGPIKERYCQSFLQTVRFTGILVNPIQDSQYTHFYQDHHLWVHIITRGQARTSSPLLYLPKPFWQGILSLAHVATGADQCGVEKTQDTGLALFSPWVYKEIKSTDSFFKDHLTVPQTTHKAPICPSSFGDPLLTSLTIVW